MLMTAAFFRENVAVMTGGELWERRITPLIFKELVLRCDWRIFSITKNICFVMMEVGIVATGVDSR